MKNNDFEEHLNAVKDMLQEKVADYLDVNRLHVKITFVDTVMAFENMPDVIEEGEPYWYEAYYCFGYKYRKSIHNAEYDDEVIMVWQHGYTRDMLLGESINDMVMTTDTFEGYMDEHEYGNPINVVTFHAPEEEKKNIYS